MKLRALIVLFAFLLMTLYSPHLFSQAKEIKIRIVKENCALKLTTSDDSLTIKILPLGSEYIVLETIGDWIKLNLPPDKDGIVVSGYVRKSTVDFGVINQPTEKAIEKPISKPIEVQPKEISVKDKPDYATVAYTEWKNDYASARTQRTTCIIGGLLGVGLLIVAATVIKPEQRFDSSMQMWATVDARPVCYILGGTTTLAALIFLIVSSSKITALEKEGEQKGYKLTLNISPRVSPFQYPNIKIVDCLGMNISLGIAF